MPNSPWNEDTPLNRAHQFVPNEFRREGFHCRWEFLSSPYKNIQLPKTNAPVAKQSSDQTLSGITTADPKPVWSSRVWSKRKVGLPSRPASWLMGQFWLHLHMTTSTFSGCQGHVMWHSVHEYKSFKFDSSCMERNVYITFEIGSIVMKMICIVVRRDMGLEQWKGRRNRCQPKRLQSRVGKNCYWKKLKSEKKTEHHFSL